MFQNWEANSIEGMTTKGYPAKDTTMRAIFVTEPTKYAVTEIPRPQCGEGEALIQTAYCGVCGTDLKVVNGTMHQEYVHYPIVPGHEWTGTIVEVGQGVRHGAIGERVVVDGYIPCGNCFYCRHGVEHLCTAHEHIGFTRNGGFGEYVVAPIKSCHPIHDHVALDEAVLVEPAATVLRAIERMSLQPGFSVAIIGCGSVGQIAIRLLLLYDPGTILAIDTSDKQRGLALGAGAAMFTSNTDPENLVHMGAGQGWDLVMDCAPGSEPMKLAFEIARGGGQVLFIGSPRAGEHLSLPADVFVYKDLRVDGVQGYTPQSWSKTLNLLASGKFKAADLITHRITLEGLTDAFNLIRLRQEPLGKVLVQYL